MICAIMQPTYLPWAGYFNLIANSDAFIFLDNVQYERGTWQQRNRIRYEDRVLWLTVPVRRDFFGQHIVDVLIDSNQRAWRKKHAATLHNAYKDCPYFSDIRDVIEMIASGDEILLSELNINLINYFCQQLQILTPKFIAHDFSVPNQRIDRLTSLCKIVQCDEYLSPIGAKDYLTDDGFEFQSDIRLQFQEFNPRPYLQGGGQGFIERLSIVDVIANCGVHGASQYILSR
jgi:hypothetical protein